MSVHAGKRWVWNTACQNSAGNEPPFGKILAYDSHIDGVFVNGTAAPNFPPLPWRSEDPFVTANLMSRIRSFGLLAGAWFVPRSSVALWEAGRASAMVTALNPDCVLLDVETHDLNFQRAFVAEYRRLKPGRATDVTFEPRQAADSVAVKEYADARFDFFPQLYRGDMRPGDPKHELFVWTALVGWGRVHLCLDAGQDWWALDEGLLFTAETLPDKRPRSVRLLAKLPMMTRRQHDKLTLTARLKPFVVDPNCGDETGEERAA